MDAAGGSGHQLVADEPGTGSSVCDHRNRWVAFQGLRGSPWPCVEGRDSLVGEPAARLRRSPGKCARNGVRSAFMGPRCVVGRHEANRAAWRRFCRASGGRYLASGADAYSPTRSACSEPRYAVTALGIASAVVARYENARESLRVRSISLPDLSETTTLVTSLRATPASVASSSTARLEPPDRKKTTNARSLAETSSVRHWNGAPTPSAAGAKQMSPVRDRA